MNSIYLKRYLLLIMCALSTSTYAYDHRMCVKSVDGLFLADTVTELLNLQGVMLNSIKKGTYESDNLIDTQIHAYASQISTSLTYSGSIINLRKIGKFSNPAGADKTVEIALKGFYFGVNNGFDYHSMQMINLKNQELRVAAFNLFKKIENIKLQIDSCKE